MPESTELSNDPSSKPSEALPLTPWQKVRKWLIAAAILAIISTSVDQLLKLFSITLLKQANDALVEGIKLVDPFNLAKIFSEHLVYGIPPESVKGYAFTQPVPEWIPGLVILFWRLVLGIIYTAIIIISSGWISTITAVAAILFGYIFLRLVFKKIETLSGTVGMVLAVPLVGCIFVWMLLQLMGLASYFFGGILWAAESYAVIAFVVPTSVWMVFKKMENDATDKIIKGLVT